MVVVVVLPGVSISGGDCLEAAALLVLPFPDGQEDSSSSRSGLRPSAIAASCQRILRRRRYVRTWGGGEDRERVRPGVMVMWVAGGSAVARCLGF